MDVIKDISLPAYERGHEGLSLNGGLSPNGGKTYTYEDYSGFNDDRRLEIVNGAISRMSPGPNSEHQIISVNLTRKFGNYLEGKKCQIFHAPFDVRLPKKGETKKTASSVVQPDIVVVCDKNKIKRRGCVGSPDLIIEILSPPTSKKDMSEKLNLYQEHKVSEYWIVDPANQIIFRFHLKDDQYGKPEYFDKNDAISSVIFSDLTINLSEVFPVPEDDEDENE